eukprot:GEMP01043124.1.p1 GENE.GEMP01043124.1~~GEMP01043124.1.p1  ORF type:complete len:293 (+),score=66.91 GEMP01043124.1:337-1215(+)
MKGIPSKSSASSGGPREKQVTPPKKCGASLFCHVCRVHSIAPGSRRLFVALKELHQKLWEPQEVFLALPSPSAFFFDLHTLLKDRIQRSLQVDYDCAAKGVQKKGKSKKNDKCAPKPRSAPTRQDGLVVVCEAISNPLNLCAVLRVCDGFGVTKAIFVNASLDKLKPSAQMRASASSSKWVTVEHYRSTSACMEALRHDGYVNLGTALHTKNPLSLYDPELCELTKGKVALWFGNEADGLSDEALAGVDRAVFIPMQGAVESLNLSVSCGICVSEVTRLRATQKHDENNGFV